MQESYEEVVTTTTTTNPPPVAAIENITPATSITQRVEHVTEDRGAQRRNTLYRVEQAIWLLLAFSEGLLAIRFVLRLLGANPAAGFAQLIYGVTTPLVAPFVGLFGTPRFEGSAFEFTTLVAMIVYALLAWVIVKVIQIVFSQDRSSVLNRWSDTPSQ